jgi:hypothetical protein
VQKSEIELDCNIFAQCVLWLPAPPMHLAVIGSKVLVDIRLPVSCFAPPMREHFITSAIAVM